MVLFVLVYNCSFAQNDIKLYRSIIQHLANLNSGIENDGYYYHRPVNQIIPISFFGEVTNAGSLVQNDIYFKSTVSDSLNNVVFLDSVHAPLIGLTDTLLMQSTGTFMPIESNEYTMVLSCEQIETDVFPSDNISDSLPVIISHSRYISRCIDYNDHFSPAEYGDNAGFVATTFTLAEKDTIKSISVYLDPLTTGGVIIGELLRLDAEYVLQIETEEMIIQSVGSGGDWFELDFITVNPGEDILEPGYRYMLGIEIYGTSGDAIYVGTDTSEIHDFDIERDLRSGSSIISSDEVPLIQANLSGYTFPYLMSSVECFKRINIYPNPAENMIFFQIETINEIYSIYNSAGQEVKRGDYNNGIDISDLVSGIYFVRVLTRKSDIYSGKFVKE